LLNRVLRNAKSCMIPDMDPKILKALPTVFSLRNDGGYEKFVVRVSAGQMMRDSWVRVGDEFSRAIVKVGKELGVSEPQVMVQNYPNKKRYDAANPHLKTWERDPKIEGHFVSVKPRGTSWGDGRVQNPFEVRQDGKQTKEQKFKFKYKKSAAR